jgi:hypothetical protein
MNADSVENLLLRNGEPVTPAHLKALTAAVARTQSSGIDVRKRILPWGTITHFSGGSGSGGTSPIFAPTITPVKDGFRVGFELGLIAGVEPSIGGVGISKKDDTGQRPALFVPRENIDASHGIGIYFRVVFNRDWQAEFAEPVASLAVPKQAAWTFHKLACILHADGSFFRALYWNLGIEIYNRGGDGIARYAPHPQ